MTTLSKEEYLKRYIMGGSEANDSSKKKKKKKNKDKKNVAKVLPRVRIIDDDAYVPSAVDKEEAPINISDDDRENEELPQIASVQDDRDIEIQVAEEFGKSGRWKTFEGGEDIAKKNLINEVIKIEQSDIKDEPLSDEEQLSDFLRNTKKKKKLKKIKVEVDVKKEPESPSRKGGSPFRRTRHDSSDNSPPRRSRHDSSDNSPPRRERHDSSDNSPPGRTRNDSSDNSPPRRIRNDSSDNSPPRRKKNDSPRINPPSSKVKQEADSDNSPPRKSRRVETDNSPPRRNGGEDSDISPPRRRGGGSDSDISPPRKGRGSDSDISPPRMKKTLDGKKAGLQNAMDLKDELKMIRDKERRVMEGLADEVSGRTAETKVRGRLAEKARLAAEEKERKEVPEEVKEKFKQWNRGVAQVAAANKRVEDDLHEMSKPMARGVDDEDRENLLRDQEYADDPMLAYMRKKKAKLAGRQKKMPVYQGPQPLPNRFGILPGYRWDGVDRGNGFEARLMTRGSNMKAREEEAYKWSTEDM